MFQADGCLEAHKNLPARAEAKVDFVPFCPVSDKTLPLLFTMPMFGLDRDIVPRLDPLARLGERLFEQPRQQTACPDKEPEEQKTATSTTV